MIGWSLAALVIASLLMLGLGVLVAPGKSSAQYGIVLADPRAFAFLRAMGIRDAVIGGLLALMALAGAREMLGWGRVVTAVIAVGDFLLVSADRRIDGATGRAEAARVLHAGGAVGLLVTAAALLAGW